MTRAELESALISQAGGAGAKGLLSRAGFSTAADGTNADLNWPIYLALSRLGVQAASPSAVHDSDLSLVPLGRQRLLVLAADLELWRALEGAFAARCDEMAAPDAKYYSQAAKAIRRALDKKEDVVARLVTTKAGTRGGPVDDTGSPPDPFCVPYDVLNPFGVFP